MDGYLSVASSASTVSAPVSRQQSLRQAIGCAGVGLHSGRKVRVTLHPAEMDRGIVFRRVDVGGEIAARYDAVRDTVLCTQIASAERPDVAVGTIEHLMAALSAAGVTNVVVEVDGPELPVLDGSAEPWLFLIECAGVAEQGAARPEIEVLRAVRVEDGEAFAELRPGFAGCLELNVSIAFPAAAIGRQSLALTLRGDAFREIARARTFVMEDEIARLRGAGLARGGSLENAVVVDGARVLNPAGLRMGDEFVRHKMLDAVGDLALGGVLRGRFVGFKSGHRLNNLVLRALFADAANWRLAESDAPRWMRSAA